MLEQKCVNGFRRGAVMMEYVILAVLIAAAALVAVIVIGRTVVRESNVAAHGMTGKGSVAASAAEGYQQETEEDVKQAVRFNRQFSDAE